MARHPWTKDCRIKGCRRAEYKGGMCHKHWDSVPLQARLRVAGDSMAAAHRAAKRGHAALRRLAKD